MSEFIDKLKSLGPKPVAPAVTGAPIFLMMGSLSGVTYKDALQFARGLAEANVTSPALGRFKITQDKPNDRYVYEIHEGGIEHAIADKVLAALAAGQPVRIALANGAHVAIDESRGEIYSLVHPAETLEEQGTVVQVAATDDGTSVDLMIAPTFSDVSTFAGAERLVELFPENQKLFKIGVICMAVSFVLFTTSGLLYTFMQAGWLNKDALLLLTKAGYAAEVSDSPAWQLEKARLEADRAGTHIKVLKKSPSGWSWELAQ